jgi:hypothetical protein
LANDTLPGDSVTAGAATDPPVPSKLTDCGLSEALSVIVRLADCVPRTVGEKTTLTVQFFPAASFVPQLFVWLNCELLAPVRVILLIVRVALPAFVMTTGCDALLLPIVCEPKPTLAVESDAMGTWSNTEMVLSWPFETTMSGRPSRLKSATAIPKASLPTGKVSVPTALKVPSPFPGSREMLLLSELTTAKSSFPLPKKSPATTGNGREPTG